MVLLGHVKLIVSGVAQSAQHLYRKVSHVVNGSQYFHKLCKRVVLSTGRETNGACQPAPGHLAPDIWRFGHLAPGQLALWTIGAPDIWLLDIWL